MPIDPSINRPRPIAQLQNPLEVMSSLAQLQGVREQTEARRLAAEEARAGRAQRQAFDQRYADAVTIGEDGTITLDTQKLFAGAPAHLIPQLVEAAQKDQDRMTRLLKGTLDLDKSRRDWLGAEGTDVVTAQGQPELWRTTLRRAKDIRAIDDATYTRLRAVTDPADILTLAQAWVQRAGGPPPKLEKVTKYDPATGQTVETFVTPTEGAEFVQPPPKTGEQVSHQSEWVLLPKQSEPVLASYNPKTQQLLYQGQDITAVARRVPPPLPQGPYMWAVPPGGTTPELLTPGEIRGEGAQKAPEPATHQQSLAGGFAARIRQAEPTIGGKVGTAISKMSLPTFELQTNSWFAKPTFQSNDVQQYMQAARNFINAVLRRESGAVISPTEFANAKAQYLPMPGDTEEAAALKKANRDLVFASMRQEAGPAYQAPAEKKENAMPDLTGLPKGRGRRFTEGPFAGQTWALDDNGKPYKVQ